MDSETFNNHDLTWQLLPISFWRGVYHETELYDRARIWVYGDFLLQAPEKPERSPNA